MELAPGLAEGLFPTEAPARIWAVFRIPALAAEDPVTVRAAVLPGDQHPLCARFVDRPRIFPRHIGTLGFVPDSVNGSVAVS